MDYSGEIAGTVHGRMIEIDGDLGLPEEQRVTVILKPPRPTPEDAKAIIARLAGAWAARLAGAWAARLAGAWADEGSEFDEYLRNCRKEDPNERPELEP